MSDSIAQIKEELQALNLSTSTPGVVGEERMEALRMRSVRLRCEARMGSGGRGGVVGCHSA